VTRALAPRFWVVHLVGVLALVVTGALGYWQLESWHARRAAERVDLTTLTPVPLGEVMGPDDPFPGQDVGQPVEIEGTWVPDGTIYVSGREHDGRDGYWMVTPLAIGAAADAPASAQQASALPVVLGWVPSPAGAPAAPTGAADLVAYLQPTEGTGQVDDDPTDDVLPQLRTADVIQHVDQDLYGAYAVSREGVDGLPAADLASLPDVSTFTALRNLLYALEWWVFGAFAAYIWWRYVRDQLLQDDAGPDDGPGDDGPGGDADDGGGPGVVPVEEPVSEPALPSSV